MSRKMRSEACLLLEVLKAKNLSIRGSDVTSVPQWADQKSPNCDGLFAVTVQKSTELVFWKYIVLDPTPNFFPPTKNRFPILIPEPSLSLAFFCHGTGTVRSTLLLGHHHVLIVFLRATLPTMVPKCAKILLLWVISSLMFTDARKDIVK